MSYPAELSKIYKDIEADSRFEHMRSMGVHLDGPPVRLVGGHGPLNPKLMLIGEAPGKMENATLVPFVGSAGYNLTRILEEEGIDRNDVYLTNIVKYWPREEMQNDKEEWYWKTRTPTEDEIEASREYIEQEISVVDPAYIGLCGRSAVGGFFPEYNKIALFNGSLIERRFVPLFHPAVLSYTPQRKNEVQAGYHKLAGYMKATNGDDEAA